MSRQIHSNNTSVVFEISKLKYATLMKIAIGSLLLNAIHIQYTSIHITNVDQTKNNSDWLIMRMIDIYYHVIDNEITIY